MLERIQKALCKAVEALNVSPEGAAKSLSIASRPGHGDYSSNFPLQTKQKDPLGFAQKLQKELVKKKIEGVEKIDVTSPGFLNFYLSTSYLQKLVGDIVGQGNAWGRSNIGRGKRVQVEFISANPTGPLTIGNGRGGFLGDALANVLDSQGYQVEREYCINDRGEQVLALGKSVKLAQGERVDIGEGEQLYRGEYIKELAQVVPRVLALTESADKAAQIVLERYIRTVVDKLGVNFTNWFSEKSLYEGGKAEKFLSDLKTKGLAYEKDGAIWMKTSALGEVDDQVLVKSNGNETYFFSDVLYHLNKFQERKFDLVIDIWGADHHGHVKRLKEALKALSLDISKLHIIITQLMRLLAGGKEVKISKRLGTYVTLEELVDEVGLDAARFFFLLHAPETHMDFDMDLVKEKSAKNPVYYVQYAHARIASILRKSETEKLETKTNNPVADASRRNGASLKLLTNQLELTLLRHLVHFPEILADISQSYRVHQLPQYLIKLVDIFHKMYEKVPVLKAESRELREARLVLVKAVQIALQNGFGFLEISAPVRM